MPEPTIVDDLHASLDELFARDVSRVEAGTLGWPQGKLVLSPAIALDTSGRAARRILIRDTHVDLRLVAEVVLEQSHSGFCQAGTEPATYRARWDLATAVVHYCRVPTEENHTAVMKAFFNCGAVLLDVMPYVKALADAVDAKRKEHP